MLHITITKGEKTLVDTDTKGVLGAINEGNGTRSVIYLDEINSIDTFGLVCGIDDVRAQVLKDHPGVSLLAMINKAKGEHGDDEEPTEKDTGWVDDN